MSQNILGIADIEHFHWTLSEADIPFASSFNGNRLSLAAAVELAAIQAHQSRKSVSFALKNCPLWSLVRASGWPGRKKPFVCRSSETVAIVIPPAEPDDIWWTTCLHQLRNQLSENGFPRGLAAGLTGGVAEMVDNVWQHSESAHCGLLIYQVRPRRFAFSVVDAGIGVLASVSAELWGNARIRSGEAALVIDRTESVRERKEIYLPALPGMHISVRCALKPPRSPLSQ